MFSCGGDVKQITTKVATDVKTAYISSSKSFDLITNYKKPFISLIDGLAMGGAAIYAMSPRYRVATERTTFAMPETAIGYFNDAGASFFLSRIKNNFGVYIGMTGVRVKGFDMKKVGLATHYIESRKLDDVERNLMNCKSHEDVEKVLKSFEDAPPSNTAELDQILPRINKCFSGATVEEIYENLRQDESLWATETIKTLNKMSPTSLKVTHRSINMGRNLSLRECFKLELRLVINYGIHGEEMKEGVRALLVDKDFKPKWNPKTVEEVTERHVGRYFAPAPGEDQLIFDENLSHKL